MLVVSTVSVVSVVDVVSRVAVVPVVAVVRTCLYRHLWYEKLCDFGDK